MSRSIFLAALAVVLVSFSVTGQSASPEPGLVAQRIADRLIANTEFELKPRAMNPVQQGYVLVHLPGAGEGAGYLVYTSLELIDPSVETSLRLSHSAGEIAVYADGALVLESNLESDGHVREVDYGVALGDVQTDEHSSSKWGRANGWTMMAKVEILKALPEDHPQRNAVLKAFRNHAQALL